MAAIRTGCVHIAACAVLRMQRNGGLETAITAVSTIENTTEVQSEEHARNGLAVKKKIAKNETSIGELAIKPIHVKTSRGTRFIAISKSGT